ncbi:hypothetical protein [Nonomuraea dietziae]|uniref:hypothetical protein n=1 Tax=Nonomuraea dietziae TaxID=65515 RepID=UPI0033E7FA9E
MATGFLLQASAAIEGFVEERCRKAAKVAIERAKKSQPTRAGYALVVWHVLRKMERAIPLTAAEVPKEIDFLDKVYKDYERLTNKSHGINGGDLRGLLIPLGLRDAELNGQLFDHLDSLSEARNPASHNKINRAKAMSDPIFEWHRVSPMLPLFESLDVAIEMAVSGA